MPTGRRAFAGDDVSETMAAVLTKEPDWSALPSGTPHAVRRLLRRCLERDPARRLRHIGDAALEIEEAQTERPESAAMATTSSRSWLPWIAALMLFAIVAAVASLWRQRPTPAAQEMHVEISTPPTTEPASIAISPDGQMIAFVATDAGRPGLWLRSLDAASAQPLAGTEGAYLPFWAPSNRSLAFFTDDGWLKRVDLDGSAPRVLAPAGLPRGGAWNADGTILFAPITGPIYRLSEAGKPTPVTKHTVPQSSHSCPRFLPDGVHFLYYVTGSPEVRGVYLARLGGTEDRRLVEADSIGASIVSGHLLFVRGGTLYAQRFDEARRELQGAAFPVAGGIAQQPLLNFQLAAVSASHAGHIIYRTGSTTPERQFAWYDRSGNEIRKVGNVDRGVPLSPSLSPDGKEVAVHRNQDGNTDIWLLDLERGSLRKFTTDPFIEIHPLWSPDGKRIVFNSNRTGSYQLVESSLRTAGEKVILPRQSQPTSWSPDGRFLLFQHRSLTSSSDISVLPYGTDQPYPIINTTADERDAQFSQDGKWIAYSSVASSRTEIYVSPFPGPGPPVPISLDGGAQPRWRPDGKELFFIALDGNLMTVPISYPTGGSLKAGAPTKLFMTAVGGAIQPASRPQYVVSSDGSRFLMNTLVEGQAPSPIKLILNWKPRPAH
jgi:Tol biopolymer transport system component